MQRPRGPGESCVKLEASCPWLNTFKHPQNTYKHTYVHMYIKMQSTYIEHLEEKICDELMHCNVNAPLPFMGTRLFLFGDTRKPQ